MAAENLSLWDSKWEANQIGWHKAEINHVLNKHGDKIIPGWIPIHDHDQLEPAYVDDVSGAPLDSRLVQRAREEELRHFREHGVYQKVPIEDCWRETGKAPIGSMWIDIDKGDIHAPDYRSRFVAKEINRQPSDDMFAATPPLEAKKLRFSMAASQPDPNGADP